MNDIDTKIIEFLEGNLAPAEIELLMEELRNDGIKQPKEYLHDLQNGIRLSSLDSFKNKLQTYEQDYKAKTKVYTLYWYLGGIAASIALLFALSIPLLNPKDKELDKDVLYAKFYIPFERPARKKDSAINYQNTLKSFIFQEKANDFFDNRNYTLATNFYKKSIKSDIAENDKVVNSETYFYLGLSEQRMGYHKQAISAFESYESLFVEASDSALPSNYYKSLSLLKLGQFKLLKSSLSKIQKQDSMYYKKAQVMTSIINN